MITDNCGSFVAPGGTAIGDFTADIGTKILGPIIFEGLRNQILSTISDESINREFLLSTA